MGRMIGTLEGSENNAMRLNGSLTVEWIVDRRNILPQNPTKSKEIAPYLCSPAVVLHFPGDSATFPHLF